MAQNLTFRLKDFVQLFDQCAFWTGADLFVDDLSAFDEKDCGDVADSKPYGQIVVFIHVTLADRYPSGIFRG